MPRKKRINSPQKLPIDTINAGLVSLSRSKIEELAHNYPMIPSEFDLYAELEDIYDMYQSMDAFLLNKPDQKNIQNFLIELADQMEWVNTEISKLTSIKSRTIKYLLQTNGCKFLNDRNQIKEFANKANELALSAKKAHKKNHSTRTSSKRSQTYLISEIIELWESKTGTKATFSLKVSSKKQSIGTDNVINTPFGNFLNDTLTILNRKPHSNQALMKTFRVVYKK